jgi:hypothetical protein
VGAVKKQRYDVNPLLRVQVTAAAVVDAIALPGLLLVVVFAPPHNESGRYAFGFLIAASVLFLPLCWWTHRVSQGWLQLDDDGLRQFDGWREVFIRWDDIDRVAYRRFAKRVKVFARDGRVVNVEQQLLGFPAAVRQIVVRGGRSIAGLPAVARIASTEPVAGTLHVGPPRGFRYVIWLATVLAAWFICIRVALNGWWGAYVAAAVGAWIVYRLNRNLRAEGAREVTLDDRGLHFRDSKRNVTIVRETIRVCRMEFRGDAVWLTLRDAGNNVLLELTRQMFNLTGSMMKRFDVLADEAVRRFDRPD